MCNIKHNTKLILCTYGEQQKGVINYGANIFGRLKYEFYPANRFFKKSNPDSRVHYIKQQIHSN